MRRPIQITLALMVLALSGCIRSQTSEPIRYEMISYFDTPSGPRAVSTTFEVTARSNNNPVWSGWDSWTGLGCRVKGDAIGPLAESENLFILTGRLGKTVGAYHCDLVKKYFGIENGPKWTEDGAVDTWRPAWAQAAGSKASAIIDPVDYPSLIRLPDLQNVSSFELVDASAGTLETDWRLRKIVLQVTQERSHQELKRRMPWLLSMPLRSGEATSDTLAADYFSSDSSDFF